MKEKKENEELQSRREFFKRAAKSALPIIGAIALSNLPIIGKTYESKYTTDCNYGCAGACYQGCYGSCDKGCTWTCYDTCKGTCDGYCKGTSKSW